MGPGELIVQLENQSRSSRDSTKENTCASSPNTSASCYVGTTLLYGFMEEIYCTVLEKHVFFVCLEFYEEDMKDDV